MSSRWVRFTRQFNYVPSKTAAQTFQYDAGAVDSLNPEAFAKAVPGYAEEIEAPANAEEAAKLKSGETEPTVIKAEVEKPARATRGSAS